MCAARAHAPPLRPAGARILRVAERLLLKVQVAVAEKAEARAPRRAARAPVTPPHPDCASLPLTRAAAQRHERETWLAKNASKLAREETLRALAEDREARREKAERAAAAAGKPPPEPLRGA